MPNRFLGLPKTTGKIVKKSGNFLKNLLWKILKKSGNGTENPAESMEFH